MNVESLPIHALRIERSNLVFITTILSRKHQAAPIRCTTASQGRGCGALPQRARRARSQATRISLIPFTRMLSLAWVGDSVYASDILLRRRYLEAVNMIRFLYSVFQFVALAELMNSILFPIPSVTCTT